MIMPAAIDVTGLLLGGLAITLSMMIVVFFVSEKIKNAGIVDIFWGLGFTLVTAAYYFCVGYTGQGWLPRQTVILSMVSVWSLRLAWFLALRFKRHYPQEDGRYAALRQALGDKAQPGIFAAFILQAVLLASVCLPFAVAMLDNRPELGPQEYAGVLIWFISLIGESTADQQLENFKKQKENREKVCNIGLWAYSRHPNYFFEWLTWVAFFIFVCASPGGLYAIYSPLVMFFFLTCVSGIKATEEQSLRTRGDAYRRYRQTTSAFFPWFKKRNNDVTTKV